MPREHGSTQTTLRPAALKFTHMFPAGPAPQCGSGAFFPSAVGAGVPPQLHPELPLPSVRVTGLKNRPQQWEQRGTAGPLAWPVRDKGCQPTLPHLCLQKIPSLLDQGSVRTAATLLVMWPGMTQKMPSCK